jgi:hypothetical protein
MVSLIASLMIKLLEFLRIFGQRNNISMERFVLVCKTKQLHVAYVICATVIRRMGLDWIKGIKDKGK